MLKLIILAVISTLILFGNITFAFDPLFNEQINYYTPGTGVWVIAADFNNDNNMDMAISHRAYGTIAIYINDGNNSFLPLSAIYAATEICRLFAADFDNDGTVDIAARADNGEIYIYYNNGDGAFTEVGFYPIDHNDLYSNQIYSEDFNNDGFFDLVVNSRYKDSISIFINNGDSTFSAGVDYYAGDGPGSIFSTDLDGDNDADIAVVDIYVDSVAVLKNNGDGTFADEVSYHVGGGPQAIFAADIDGDNDNDLVTANYSTDSVSILKNNGDGTFSTAVNYYSGEEPNSIFMADFDNDNDNDIVVTSYQYLKYSILKNNGDGSYSAPISYGADYGLRSVYAADFDNDSDYDLAVTYGDYAISQGVTIIDNLGDGTFLTANSYGSGVDEPYSLFSRDYDRDGDFDLAVINSGSNEISILKNNGDGTFAAAYAVGSVDQVGSHYSIFSEDFDSDNDYDLAVCDYGVGYVSVLLNNGDATFTPEVNYSVYGQRPLCIYSADFDNDNDMDLAVPASRDSVFIFKNDGNGDFSESVGYYVDYLSAGSIFSGDFDNDNDYDLAIAAGGLRILLNNGDGTFGTEEVYGVYTHDAIYGADFDSDGDLDLVGGSGHTIAVYFNGGTGIFDSMQEYNISGSSGIGNYYGNCASIISEDFDVDGDFDIAIAYYFGMDCIQIILNEGDGTFNPVHFGYDAGLSPFSVVSKDFDDDGYFDLAVANFGSSDISILFNQADVIDSDNDDVPNIIDNCPYAYNPGQEDSDSDSVGNVCDNCPDSANTDQLDSDGDGTGNVCDPCPFNECEPGNANGDETINIFDITYIISYLYLEGPAPTPYELCSGDPNCDCTCNIFTITYLISFLYLDGPAPCTCEQWMTSCGPPLRN